MWLFFFFFPPQPCFDMFYNHVKKLFSNDATLSYMEKCTLMEALVLISNQFKDFAKQKAFLDELMASVVAELTSEEMRRWVWNSFHFLVLSVITLQSLMYNLTVISYCFSVLWDPAMFLSFVGADQVVTEESKEKDATGLHRGRVGV